MAIKLEGMTEWELEEIRSRLPAMITFGEGITPMQIEIVMQIVRDRAALLHEVDRLRARVGAYQLCPMCRGQKHVQTPPWWPGDRVFEWVGPGTFPELHICSLCTGRGVIERPRPPKDTP